MIRPDVAKAASKLAEFLLNPSPEHLSQINQAISYLYTTRFYAIEYSALLRLSGSMLGNGAQRAY